MKPIIISLFPFFLSSAILARDAGDFTMYFPSRVKVSAHFENRPDIREFFGNTLNRKVDMHEEVDVVRFDGGGFVAFVYQDDPSLVPDKEEFSKYMQVAIEVPEKQYDTIRSLIISSGVEIYQPSDERFPEEKEKLHFHAPGGQIIKLEKLKPSPLVFDVDERFDPAAAAHYGADEYGVKKYVMAFLKKGPNPSADKERAAELQRAHLKNITRLAEEGFLLLAGPFFGDGELRGIYLFDVGTIEEARELTNTDPAIQAGALEMELKEWYGSAAIMTIPSLSKKLSRKSITE
jgi:uncharacterized protein YciI